MMWHDRKWRTCCGTVSQKRLKWILSECCNEYDAHIHFNCNMTKTLEQLKSYGNTKKEKRTAVLVPFRRSDLNGRTRPLLIFGCYICVAVFSHLTMMMWHDRKWRTCCGTVSQKRLKWLNVAFSTARRAWAVILPTHWNMFIWELRKWQTVMETREALRNIIRCCFRLQSEQIEQVAASLTELQNAC